MDKNDVTVGSGLVGAPACGDGTFPYLRSFHSLTAETSRVVSSRYNRAPTPPTRLRSLSARVRSLARVTLADDPCTPHPSSSPLTIYITTTLDNTPSCAHAVVLRTSHEASNQGRRRRYHLRRQVQDLWLWLRYRFFFLHVRFPLPLPSSLYPVPPTRLGNLARARGAAEPSKTQNERAHARRKADQSDLLLQDRTSQGIDIGRSRSDQEH